MASAHPEVLRFAANLRTVRKRAGLSQLDLAYTCGVHPSVIARIETGNREPRLTTITRLARGLDVSAAELMTALPLDDPDAPAPLRHRPRHDDDR
jgi:transcriptional regulator with XRE-family HTH domain